MKNSQSHDKEGIQTLSISDWISYLSSEKNPNLGNVVSIGAFVFAALAATLAIIMSVTDNTLLGFILAVLVAIALLSYFFIHSALDHKMFLLTLALSQVSLTLAHQSTKKDGLEEASWINNSGKERAFAAR